MEKQNGNQKFIGDCGTLDAYIKVRSCAALQVTGRTGIERITRDTPDISEWLDFDIYDLVWFRIIQMQRNPRLEDGLESHTEWKRLMLLGDR
jgi:hypothetical protein